ncbi:MAG: aminopeptidase [Gammaproteobacteria bacterium]|nr:MAG: aminopeptidase [Gammaproteobacteria bacterium]
MPGESYTGALAPLDETGARLRERLRHHVTELAERIGERNMGRPRALDAARAYIVSTFRELGLEAVERPFQVNSQTVANIEAILGPANSPQPALVVGAHYDSVIGSPGANDNGTGVAALLELARLLRGEALARPLRLVAFVNEEPPYFQTRHMGSRVYADELVSEGVAVMGMLSLETLGYYSDTPGSQQYPFPFGLFYPDTGNFIGFVANLRARALVRRVVASFRRHARFPSEGTAAPAWLPGIGWSDQWSFWRVGIPAVMVTDTAPFRFPQYHTAGDRPQVVDFDRLTRVTLGLRAVLAEFAQ